MINNIVRRMLHLFRMYRLVAYINNTVTKENEDYFLQGFNGYRLLPWIDMQRLMKEYRYWFHCTPYRVRKLVEDAIDNGYLLAKGDGIILVRVNGDKGRKLVEGYGWGFIRELLAKERRFLSVAFLVLGWVVGLITAGIIIV